MKVYPREIEDGLGEAITASSVLAYCLPVETPTSAPKFKLDKKLPILASVNNSNLFELVSILVTSGINKNDDVFLVDELYKARKSPVDTGLNYNHKENEIVGHITAAQMIDEDFNVIGDNVAPEDLPSKVHILTSAVLYKYWRNKDLQERMDGILAEIEEGKLMVSLEVVASDFDYLLTDQSGKQFIIARDQNSSFLTKALRCYKGNGVFKEYAVARLLRDFDFIGKGLTAKPANPESVIFNDVTAFNGIFSSASTLDENIVTETEMANENTDKLSEVSGLLALAQADVATKAGELANLVKSKDALVAEKSTLEATVAELTQEKSELSKKVAELNDAVAATAASEKAAKDELAKVKAEQLKTSRLSLLAEVGKTKEESEGLVAQFEALSDVQFGEIVKLAKASVKPEVKTEVTAEEVGKEVLESATENKEAALASETSKDEVVLAEKLEITEFIQKNRKSKGAK